MLELDASGHVIHMTPTGGETGARNQALAALLWLAVRTSGLPLKPLDSFSGFRLPDGCSVLIPEQQAVEIWPARGSGEPQRIEAASDLNAAPLFPGLQIPLQEIWQA